RRFHRRRPGGTDRYHRTRLPSGSAASSVQLAHRGDRRSRDVLHDDLSAHGDCAHAAPGRPLSGLEQMKSLLAPRNAVIAAVVLLLLALPVYTQLTGNAFLVTLFTRIVILAMAATSLNLILGYGGMVSFGHSVYLGIGGYAIGIPSHQSVASRLLHRPVGVPA